MYELKWGQSPGLKSDPSQSHDPKAGEKHGFGPAIFGGGIDPL